MGIKVGIIGASGFTGAELMRLLFAHSHFDLIVATSAAEAGKPVSAVVPAFAGQFAGQDDFCFSDHDDPRLFDCEAVFLAVPHTAALNLAPQFLAKGISVFDLSADYRLKDKAVYEKWYATAHTSPDLLAAAVFGLPEIFRDELLQAQLQHAQGVAVLVACAGCYPTASSLAAYPAIQEGLARPPVVINAISGITGAGKGTNERTHYCFANENLEAYSVGNHRHLPEIEQILGLSGGVVFTPHLAPLNRGLLSTVYIPLENEVAQNDITAIHQIYQNYYAQSPFVSVLDEGTMPKTSSVVGTNKAHLGLKLLESANALIAVAAIDNLCKGASGQAVQCANVVFGFKEDVGLAASALSV